MGELMIKPQNLVSLFHGTDITDLPFQKDIFLYRTFIAGTSYVEGIEELASFMKEGDRLPLVREADNWVDDMAIKVVSDAGVKLGYVPRIDNKVFARLMDAGKLLYTKVVSVDAEKLPIRITIDIFMQD